MLPTEGLMQSSTQKKKTSLLLPGAVMDVFQEAAKPYGEKRKWSVFSAAVLLIAGMSGEELDEVVEAVNQAEAVREDQQESRYQELVERARSGEFRPSPRMPSGRPVRHAAKVRKGQPPLPPDDPK